MTERSELRPDVLAVVVALASNPEAFKRASRMVEHECFITTDPVAKLSEWAIALVGTLATSQKHL
jgi:hypothetical protein